MALSISSLVFVTVQAELKEEIIKGVSITKKMEAIALTLVQVGTPVVLVVPVVLHLALI